MKFFSISGRIPRITGLFLFLLLFAWSLTSHRANAAAPSVTYVGADLTTNDAWRTTSIAKALDADGDNIYGTDGFYLFGGWAQPPTRISLPTYATVTQRPGTLLFAGNASYIFYDNPDLTGSGAVPNIISGVVYSQPGGSNPTEWADITFTKSGLFRVGIITDNADVATISPLNFRFQQITGGTVDTGYISAATDRDRDIDYYLFDIEANAGDVYRISGQNDSGHPSNGIAGIFFDGYPYQTITDTTAGTATNNGTIAVGEYVGFSTGINNGFGNVLGSNSQLHINSDGNGNLNLGLKAGATVGVTDAMVIYIDTDNGATGFPTTSGFTDIGDNCRKAISGFDGGNRAILNFSSGFSANYAICLDNSFAGLWQLTNGGSHTFITALNRSNTGTDYEMNLTMADLGLNAGSSFRYLATYLNATNAFRSNEFHGVETYSGSNPGYTTLTLPFNSFIVFESMDSTLIVDRSDDTNAPAAQGCNDSTANDCSLRGAISKANADTTGSYTISFDPSLNGTPITLTIPGIGEDANATGDLDITDDLTISGNGAANTIIQAGTNNTNGIDRVFHVVSNVFVTLNSITIRYGYNTGEPGGGIANNGTLVINTSTIESNTGNTGGGIHNNASSVTINQTTIRNNSADYGGGIANIDGTITLNRSTVSGNSVSNNGGGVDSDAFSLPATLNVYNSTFSGNTAGFAGGAILAYTGNSNTTVNLINATIHNNTAGSGALNSWDNGAGSATINMQNSLIADQAGATDNCTSLTGGLFVSNNYNLDSDNTCNLTQPNDLSGGIANLGPLQNNGGPTQTHAPESDSEVIDAGNNTVCAATPINNVDQRGISRPQNTTCDIGAFEYVHPIAPGTSGGNGPGGVGVVDGSSSLELWLKAGAGVTTAGGSVSTWADQSGNSANVQQSTAGNQPLHVTNQLNGQPIVRFDGNNDYLDIPNSVIQGRTAFSFFTAFKPNGSNAWQRLWDFGQNTTVYGYVTTNWNGLNSPRFGISTSGIGAGEQALSYPGSLTIGNPELVELVFTGSNGFGFQNGGAQGSAGFTLTPNSLGTITQNRIGRSAFAVDSYLNADMGEFVVYSTALNDTDRILVENYLSAKYNLALSANDVYDGDTNGSGNFDLDVAGIGQTGGNPHTQAYSAGMIVVNNTFLKENGDWLLFGHKTATNSNITTYLPTGSEWTNPNAKHWARYWYIDVTDTNSNTGTVNIVFDFSEAGMGSPASLPDGPASNYRLLKRSNEVDNYTDITSLSGATVVIVDDQVQFLGVDVSYLGSNFTLGTLDFVDSPTALTLQSFTARTGTLPLAGLLGLVGVGLLGLVLRWRR